MNIPELYKNLFKDFLIICLIFLFTFPAFIPDYGIGLDTSYIWGLNWLFANDYDTLIRLLHPVGPLSFLKWPTTEGNNLLFSLIFYFFIKTGFIFLLFRLMYEIYGQKHVAAVFFIVLASLFANVDFIIIFSCVVSGYLFIKSQNLLYFAVASVLVFTGLFIKSSIGITSFSVLPVVVAVNFWLSRNFTFVLKQAVIATLAGFIIGLLVYKGNAVLLLEYVFGILRLSSSNSETLSLHPENNWLVLSLFIALVFSLPLIVREKNTRIFMVLLMLPFFATWKHSMSRQDVYHYSILAYFVIISGSIISLVSRQSGIRALTVGLACLMLVYYNMLHIPMNEGIKAEITGVNNLFAISNFQEFSEKHELASRINISPNIISEETRLKKIGDAEVDIYPWEHSYIAANNFKWKPRKMLEIGASTAKWTSEASAKNYERNSASPEFVLFHFVKDKYSGNFGSIDERYILNDEPHVIFNILNNYNLEEKTDHFLLFRKNKGDNLLSVETEELTDNAFGKWVNIPFAENEITRLKVSSSNTFLGKAKKFLYKEEAYYIDYQFEDGKVLTYRYVPSTALDGLWCNPFILNPENDFKEQKVVKVRLRNTNSLFIKNEIKTQIERIKTGNTDANVLFGKTKPINQIILIQSNITSEHMGTNNEISPQGYSYTYEFPLDSIWNLVGEETENLLIESDVFIKSGPAPVFVMEITGSAEDLWHGEHPKNLTPHTWTYIFINKRLNRNNHQNGKLKVYVWNNGKNNAYFDNFRLTVKTSENK
jgi:hypothetical protein